MSRILGVGGVFDIFEKHVHGIWAWGFWFDGARSTCVVNICGWPLRNVSHFGCDCFGFAMYVRHMSRRFVGLAFWVGTSVLRCILAIRRRNPRNALHLTCLGQGFPMKCCQASLASAYCFAPRVWCLCFRGVSDPVSEPERMKPPQPFGSRACVPELIAGCLRRMCFKSGRAWHEI